jgi:hypothetical protein
MSSSAGRSGVGQSRRDWTRGLTAIAGGALVAVGSILPWMSLFAGLQRYPGVDGLYGRLALTAGAIAFVGGIAILIRPQRRPSRLRLGIGVLGVALALFACWILLGLRSTIRELGHHPLLLARSGPGVFVVVAGAIALATLLLPTRQRI